MTTVLVCVYCRKHPMDERWRPFCSERCKLLDLAAWADGSYHIAAEPVDPAGQSDPADVD